MRSGERAAAGPRSLLVAAAALALEAVGLCAVIVVQVIGTVSGNAYQVPNAIALILIEAIVAVGLAWIGLAVVRARAWSRTPAVMAQLCTAIIAIWLLQAGQYPPGVPALLVAIAGLAGLFAPASLRALTRQVNRPLLSRRP